MKDLVLCSSCLSHSNLLGSYFPDEEKATEIYLHIQIDDINEKSWIAKVDEELIDSDGTCEAVLAEIIKDFLFSDGRSTASNTARRINSFYQNDYLLWDPLMRYEEDKGMVEFLTGFYEVICIFARLVPYNSPFQEQLVRLNLELRKLPPTKVKIWEVCVNSSNSIKSDIICRVIIQYGLMSR
jgi:hypothetical protein